MVCSESIHLFNMVGWKEQCCIFKVFPLGTYILMPTSFFFFKTKSSFRVAFIAFSMFLSMLFHFGFEKRWWWEPILDGRSGLGHILPKKKTDLTWRIYLLSHCECDSYRVLRHFLANWVTSWESVCFAYTQ